MKKLKIGLLIVLGLLLIAVGVYYFKVRVDEPEIAYQAEHAKTVNASEGFFQTDNGSFLKENSNGLWEMYLKGKPYELGVAFGALAHEAGLIQEKEAAFVSEIENRIPSASYLNFLKYMVGWFNRDLEEYIPTAYLNEIYGSSHYMPDAYDYIAPKFHRALSYHAAHDIGHALQNMNLVGCTSFATWGEQSDNNQLLIGRNFDFYFGEEFSKDKIIAFYRPENGYQFMSVTWACFSGVVSGMNEKGLTITLNAAKSAIPTKGKTPVSIIARDILQQAGNIEEALAIANKYESFVAETFLIGSKADNEVGLIEKSPGKTALFTSQKNEMVITNHFQSDELKNDPLNLEYEAEGVSGYRYKRVKQLIDSLAPLSAKDVASILRDKKGLNGQNIGLSNEKAINQLVAHHSVIFSPHEMIAWVSAPPYVLGEYVAYDLNEIFATTDQIAKIDSLSIPQDSFATSTAFKAYQRFVDIKAKIQTYLFKGGGEQLTNEEIHEFIQSNPDGFLTYYYLGDYMLMLENYEKAQEYFKIGLTKDIAKVSEHKHMLEGLAEAREKLKSSGKND